MQKGALLRPFISRLNYEKCLNNFDNLFMIKFTYPERDKKYHHQRVKKLFKRLHSFFGRKCSQYFKLIL